MGSGPCMREESEVQRKYYVGWVPWPEAPKPHPVGAFLPMHANVRYLMRLDEDGQEECLVLFTSEDKAECYRHYSAEIDEEGRILQGLVYFPATATKIKDMILGGDPNSRVLIDPTPDAPGIKTTVGAL